MRRRGPSLIQPYRDLIRLMRKEVVLADNASWLFRVIPYIIFATTWVAAALVPTFRTGLLFSWSADLIAIIALLGSARFFLALAGLDVGTSFGGIGSSREVMIASLAEPAMLMIVFTLALVAGSTQLSTMAGYMVSPAVGLARFARARADRAHHGGDRGERAHPGRQSGNASGAHHGARGHGAGIFRPSSRVDRSHGAAEASALRIAHRLLVRAVGSREPPALAPAAVAVGIVSYVAKLAVGGFLLAMFETRDRQDAGVPRTGIPRRGIDAGSAWHAAPVRLAESLGCAASSSMSLTCWPEVSCW